MAGSYLLMYLVPKLPRQEFLSRGATVQIIFSSRTFAVLQMKKRMLCKGTCFVECLVQ